MTSYRMCECGRGPVTPGYQVCATCHRDENRLRTLNDILTDLASAQNRGDNQSQARFQAEYDAKKRRR